MKTRALVALAALTLLGAACATETTDDDAGEELTTTTTSTTIDTTETTESDTTTTEGDTDTTAEPDADGTVSVDDAQLDAVESAVDAVEQELQGAQLDPAVMDVWAQFQEDFDQVVSDIRDAGGEVPLDDERIDQLRAQLQTLDDAVGMGEAELPPEVLTAWEEFRDAFSEAFPRAS